jgi:small neutral amino acid transporter SnatA (MarC family)
MMLDEPVKFFVVLLVVVEPLSLHPVLAGLTQGTDDSYRRHLSYKAVGISAAVCLVFTIGGAALLQLLGISVDAFKVGARILLFLLAVEMVVVRPSGVRSTTPREDAESHERVGSAQFLAQILVIFVVLAITLALMLATGPVMRAVGVTGGAVLGGLLGVLLAALAAQFVMDGIRGAMTTPAS